MEDTYLQFTGKGVRITYIKKNCYVISTPRENSSLFESTNMQLSGSISKMIAGTWGCWNT